MLPFDGCFGVYILLIWILNRIPFAFLSFRILIKLIKCSIQRGAASIADPARPFPGHDRSGIWNRTNLQIPGRSLQICKISIYSSFFFLFFTAQAIVYWMSVSLSVIWWNVHYAYWILYVRSTSLNLLFLLIWNVIDILWSKNI